MYSSMFRSSGTMPTDPALGMAGGYPDRARGISSLMIAILLSFSPQLLPLICGLHREHGQRRWACEILVGGAADRRLQAANEAAASSVTGKGDRGPEVAMAIGTNDLPRRTSCVIQVHFASLLQESSVTKCIVRTYVRCELV